MKYKLNFELIPDSCWYSNLRTLLSKRQWDFLREEAKEKSDYKCSICGRKGLLEAHERWSYDLDNGVQKLTDIIAVCKDCHSVIHIGRTQLVGDEERAENHFMKVNNATYVEYRKALKEANEYHKKLNQVSEWKLDLTYLQKYIKPNE